MIRKAIKEVMKARKVKQIDLANYAGVSKSAISQFLKGDINLSVTAIEAIFKYLQIDLHYKK